MIQYLYGSSVLKTSQKLPERERRDFLLKFPSHHLENSKDAVSMSDDLILGVVLMLQLTLSLLHTCKYPFSYTPLSNVSVFTD